MDLGLKKIVVGVFVKSESNEILMVQEAKDEVKWLFNFPIGRLEDGESIFECAIREAKEETWFDVKLNSILSIQYFVDKCILKIIFNATIKSGTISFDKNEIMNVKWIPIEKLENMSKDILRSYDSIIDIINNSKNNIQYPLSIIKNF